MFWAGAGEARLRATMSAFEDRHMACGCVEVGGVSWPERAAVITARCWVLFFFL
jgi:hypothetical protein